MSSNQAYLHFIDLSENVNLYSCFLAKVQDGTANKKYQCYRIMPQHSQTLQPEAIVNIMQQSSGQRISSNKCYSPLTVFTHSVIGKKNHYFENLCLLQIHSRLVIYISLGTFQRPNTCGVAEICNQGEQSLSKFEWKLCGLSHTAHAVTVLSIRDG